MTKVHSAAFVRHLSSAEIQVDTHGTPVCAGKVCTLPVCIHIGGTAVTGCTALHSEAVTPSSGHGNVVGAGMTQLSGFAGNTLRI